ncbi:hypothetical protein PS900_03620 [Pseudomonas fluorescens]|uniref:Lipoprotein n=1 Tax=Pseudomonas fluorescens TaxID=294 RepID=A0A8H2RR49_PSEFL|nr:hypothetical protein [Pseudomonas fluorescens]VVP16465.1 hypothetical protein PS900_03620 [Pseudomonas fluorescens]
MSKNLSILFLNGAFILGGCQSNARLTFIDKSTGNLYTGETGATYRASNGDAKAQIDNDTYYGVWSYQASGGSYSLVCANSVSTGSWQASDGYNTVNASGTSYNYGTVSSSTRSAQGDGLINIKGFSGAFIRCVFTFNNRSSSGRGQCIRNDGREYDLTIQR